MKIKSSRIKITFAIISLLFIIAAVILIWPRQEEEATVSEPSKEILPKTEVLQDDPFHPVLAEEPLTSRSEKLKEELMEDIKQAENIQADNEFTLKTVYFFDTHSIAFFTRVR